MFFFVMFIVVRVKTVIWANWSSSILFLLFPASRASPVISAVFLSFYVRFYIRAIRFCRHVTISSCSDACELLHP